MRRAAMRGRVSMVGFADVCNHGKYTHPSNVKGGKATAHSIPEEPLALHDQMRTYSDRTDRFKSFFCGGFLPSESPK